MNREDNKNTPNWFQQYKVLLIFRIMVVYLFYVRFKFPIWLAIGKERMRNIYIEAILKS